MSLAVTPSRQFALDQRAHVLRFGLDQRLRRQHMLDFRGADAVGERAEGAVRRGVAVAADQRGAGQREALLRADDVHDALALVELVVIFEAEILGVLRQRGDLRGRFPDRDLACCGRWSARCGRPRPASFGRVHLAPGGAQALEGLRAGHLMHQMAVDIDQAGAVRAARRPDGRPRSCRRGCAVSLLEGLVQSERAWLADAARCAGARKDQRPACTQAISRPKKRQGSRAWSVMMMR